jgi:hypothetical protein
MLAALLSLAGAHVGSLMLGGAAAAGIEVALPFLTHFQKARKAIAMARMISRLMHGRDLTPEQVHRVSLDSNLTK